MKSAWEEVPQLQSPWVVIISMTYLTLMTKGKYVYCSGVDDKPDTQDQWRNIVMILTTNLTLMTMTKENYIFCGDIKS